MKRFHVHLHVDDLAQSIAFYSKLFAAQPARVEADYAKWMLDDPAVNFAISTRGSQPGIDHLGFQTDDAAELAVMKADAQSADMAVLDESAGRERTVAALRGETGGLGGIVGSRQFLVDIIGGIAAQRGVSLATLADILGGLPRQR